jgi:hypothetical protein
MDNDSSNDGCDSVYTLIAYMLGYGLPATSLGGLLMRAPAPFNGIGLAVLALGVLILLVRLVWRYTRGAPLIISACQRHVLDACAATTLNLTKPKLLMGPAI